jgi:hypothetical protein
MNKEIDAFAFRKDATRDEMLAPEEQKSAPTSDDNLINDISFVKKLVIDAVASLKISHTDSFVAKTAAVDQIKSLKISLTDSFVAKNTADIQRITSLKISPTDTSIAKNAAVDEIVSRQKISLVSKTFQTQNIPPMILIAKPLIMIQDALCRSHLMEGLLLSGQ